MIYRQLIFHEINPVFKTCHKVVRVVNGLLCFLYYSIDATPEPTVNADKAKLGRLVNHGEPLEINTKMKVVDVGDTPALCLFAIKDLESGQELLYDYGIEDLPWKQVRVQLLHINCFHTVEHTSHVLLVHTQLC